MGWKSAANSVLSVFESPNIPFLAALPCSPSFNRGSAAIGGRSAGSDEMIHQHLVVWIDASKPKEK